jgi:endonuclease/exonuclease/phosphatase family metal-dependent hydrolase
VLKVTIKRPAYFALPLALTLMSWGAVSCVTSILSNPFNRDPLVLTVGTASFDNQRVTIGETSCQADWVLRRERLHLIDGELISAQPDILVLQGVMAKSSSAYDSDQVILQAGALGDFRWTKTVAHYYSDTDEDEYFAVAAKQSILHGEPGSQPEQAPIGQDGVVVLQTLKFKDQQALTLANIHVPTSTQEQAQSYSLIKETLETYLAKEQRCGERLVLAGFVGDANAGKFRKLLGELGLYDTSLQLCADHGCVMPQSENPLFASRADSPKYQGSYRIYLPLSSRLVSASAFLNKASAHKLFSEKYHFDQLWPSAYPGELVQVKFASCP